MSKKPVTSLKKPINLTPQLSTEILRIVLARSEDIAILKAVSDRKTGKLRTQTAVAEKTLQDIEYKEEWRVAKEDNVLLQLFNVKIDNPAHKKNYEKDARKILRINLQFEDEPTEHEMNSTEIQVQKVMNAKIGPESTYSYLDELGESHLAVPAAIINVATWREQYCRATKILESCLYGEAVYPFLGLNYCTQYSRANFCNELKRQ